MFYRAECTKLKEYCASVLFIDFGNFGDVQFMDIHKMPLDLITTPAMGIFCNLPGTICVHVHVMFIHLLKLDSIRLYSISNTFIEIR